MIEAPFGVLFCFTMIKKRYLLLSLLLSGCQISQPSPSLAGQYQTPHKPQEYWQQVNITPLPSHQFQIEITASKVRHYPACEYQGTGFWQAGKIWVNLEKDKEKPPIYMWITPLSPTKIDIFTQHFEDRFRMMYYCMGGASLAGEYMKNA